MAHPMTALSRDTYPASHFEDIDQQNVTVTLGMWTFLATEILFIGAVFVAFFIYRLRWPETFTEGAHELKWYLGTINTAILLGSSLGMALAVHAARHRQRKPLVRWLLITMALGTLFLGVKLTEYSIEYHDHLIPGLNYSDVSPTGEPRSEQLRLFMTFYFVMTGVHAIHMIAGLGVMAVITYFAWKGKFTTGYYNPVEMSGLYWHFVDLVWVFLFPTLYLLRF
jgi:cytochrome c oxidase subunit 3